MEAMKQMPDKAFDLAIVDPPYGRGEDGGTNRTHNVRQKNGSLLLCVDGGYTKKAWDKEPPPPDHPLWKAPNVILTPHLAFYSQEAVVELQTKVAEEAARAFWGEPPRSPVNREVLKA